MAELLPLFLFLLAMLILFSGFPVAFCLGGVSILFALSLAMFGHFDLNYLSAIGPRMFGIMTNETLIAIPLFIFMGITLEKSKMAEELLDVMSKLFGSFRGGMAVSVCVVGGLLAASTGIVGATVVTMGLISLPSMLRKGYPPSFSSGVICASGTLGQIIPPSIVLIILGDVLGSAYQQAQLEQGIFSPKSISSGDLFKGALLPGIILLLLYIAYVVIYVLLFSKKFSADDFQERNRFDWRFVQIAFKTLIPPFLLILGVLGSIFAGAATPTEAASVGCVGALLLSGLRHRLSFQILRQICLETTKINAMIFSIIIGANVFSLVFRGLEGDITVQRLLIQMGGDPAFIFLIIMALVFLLGFFLDFFEIIFVVIPIVAPILLQLGVDPVWLGVMIALNLQTSFLTPPFGFSLFYLRGVAPKDFKSAHIYRGAVPFIGIQIFMLLIVYFFPQLTQLKIFE
jgi:tripartite ATP-independent transporter DctM subunit